LRETEFQDENTDQEIFDTINLGHGATAMLAWGEILTQEQIQQLVKFIRQFEPAAAGPTPQAGTATPAPEDGVVTPTAAVGEGETSFSAEVMPIFEAQCAACHGSFGGWSAASYGDVMTTGDNAPAVIPGDAENSLLAQKILGTHEEGTIMPPSGKMDDDEIQVILDWIEAGASDN
jgi:mono/diheme cytochrome c family protein